MMNNSESYFLSIDAGTQSIRAALIDRLGNFLDLEKIAIEPYFSLRPGWAEQDPQYLWEKFCECTNKLLSRNQSARIASLSVTTQRGTVFFVDKDGNPLRAAITWLDQRQAKEESWPGPLLKSTFKIAQVWETIHHAKSESELNWVRQNEKEIWNKTSKILFVSGFFQHKLTGKFVDSTGNIVGFVPYDYKNNRWAKPNDLKWKLFPSSLEQYPELVWPGTQIGTVSENASRETGIPSGTIVIASASDKACEILGAGVLEPGKACLSFGTAATVSQTLKRYVEVVPLLPSYSAAVPGHHNTEVMIRRGFWMVNWFKKQFAHREVSLASEQGVAAEVLFDALLNSVPAGSEGLVLQPYWSPGVRQPGSEARGAIIGFSDVHTRAHLYRAIVEGLAFALKAGLETTQKRTGTFAKELVVAGGGSQSEEGMKITANVFNITTSRPHTFETSALGAAINMAVGMGIYPSYEKAIGAMCRFRDKFEPNPQQVIIYNQLYNKVYKKMYSRLQPLYSRLKEIDELRTPSNL